MHDSSDLHREDDNEPNLRGPHAAVPATVPPVRTTLYDTMYYIHTHDGRLLAEYDDTGACVRDYIYFGNRLIAECQPSTNKTYYYTADQINSVRIVTDSSGSLVYSTIFDPYGGQQKIWVSTFQPFLEFSGKERERNSGLDYFGARYFNHGNYRFISVDPVINKSDALTNPQLWNMYAYCRNNPVTFYDPNGKTEIIITISRTGANSTRTLGTMSVANNTNNSTLSLYTLELPDSNNQANTSRINADSYDAETWESPTHGNVVKLEDKNNRTNILIHPGNTADDTKGCILPGTGQTESKVTGSKAARNQIINYINNIKNIDSSSNQATTIKVVINDPASEK